MESLSAFANLAGEQRVSSGEDLLRQDEIRERMVNARWFGGRRGVVVL